MHFFLENNNLAPFPIVISGKVINKDGTKVFKPHWVRSVTELPYGTTVPLFRVNVPLETPSLLSFIPIIGGLFGSTSVYHQISLKQELFVPASDIQILSSTHNIKVLPAPLKIVVSARTGVYSYGELNGQRHEFIGKGETRKVTGYVQTSRSGDVVDIKSNDSLKRLAWLQLDDGNYIRSDGIVLADSADGIEPSALDVMRLNKPSHRLYHPPTPHASLFDNVTVYTSCPDTPHESAEEAELEVLRVLTQNEKVRAFPAFDHERKWYKIVGGGCVEGRNIHPLVKPFFVQVIPSNGTVLYDAPSATTGEKLYVVPHLGRIKVRDVHLDRNVRIPRRYVPALRRSVRHQVWYVTETNATLSEQRANQTLAYFLADDSGPLSAPGSGFQPYAAKIVSKIGAQVMAEPGGPATKKRIPFGSQITVYDIVYHSVQRENDHRAYDEAWMKIGDRQYVSADDLRAEMHTTEESVSSVDQQTRDEKKRQRLKEEKTKLSNRVLPCTVEEIEPYLSFIQSADPASVYMFPDAATEPIAQLNYNASVVVFGRCEFNSTLADFGLHLFDNDTETETQRWLSLGKRRFINAQDVAPPNTPRPSLAATNKTTTVTNTKNVDEEQMMATARSDETPASWNATSSTLVTVTDRLGCPVYREASFASSLERMVIYGERLYSLKVSRDKTESKSSVPERYRSNDKALLWFKIGENEYVPNACARIAHVVPFFKNATVVVDDAPVTDAPLETRSVRTLKKGERVNIVSMELLKKREFVPLLSRIKKAEMWFELSDKTYIKDKYVKLD